MFAFYSSIVKALSKVKIPVHLRKGFFYTFGKIAMKMRNKDFEQISSPLESFDSISAFFSRKINLELRPLGKEKLVSPCDGVISEYGNINDHNHMIRVKGKSYSLINLLDDRTLSSTYSGGSYVIIYLSPRNYHRFHVPLSGQIQHLKRVEGKCFPVNRLGLFLAGDVYSENARVILEIDGSNIKVCMAIVGACAVRGIKILKHKDDKLEKGEELGWFELGSSIVLVFNKKIFPGHKPTTDDVKARGCIFKNELLF